MKQATSSRPVLLDGAMGTELIRAGAAATNLDALCIDRPAAVQAVHRAYARAGAEILTTNTFGANRFRLGDAGVAHSVEAVNRAAVQLARAEAPPGTRVAGCIGPSGRRRQRPTEAQLLVAYREQAATLHSAGVDLFSCETFGDLAELRSAILAIREVSHLPILASLTFTPDGCTPLGQTPAEMATILDDLPVDAIGANCVVGDGTMLRVMHALAVVTDRPLIAQPNAGEPRAAGGALRYDCSPAQLAELGAVLRPLVAYLGSCCGTTPAHTAALDTMLEA